MGCNITQSVVDQAGDELAALFKKKAKQMRQAWEKTAGNLTVALSCTWKPAEDNNAIAADLGIKFKLAEVNEKDAFVFSDGFGPLFEPAWHRPIPTSFREQVLWRDFRSLAADLALTEVDRYDGDFDAVEKENES